VPTRAESAGRRGRFLVEEGDRVLRLLFSDGTTGDVDFSAKRWTGVLAPKPLYEQAKAHSLIAA
jgi:hypothetical protein